LSISELINNEFTIRILVSLKISATTAFEQNKNDPRIYRNGHIVTLQLHVSSAQENRCTTAPSSNPNNTSGDRIRDDWKENGNSFDFSLVMTS
jgi:hypothetical protein